MIFIAAIGTARSIGSHGIAQAEDAAARGPQQQEPARAKRGDMGAEVDDVLYRC